MEDLQPVLEECINGSYSIFEFQTIHIFHFDTLKFLKECTLTYQGSDATRSHPGKMFHASDIVGSRHPFYKL